MRNRGFTLLEVMVAVTILGMGLTMILSAQTGLLGSAWRIQNQAQADTLIRCKMSEIEVKLLRDGYSMTDENDSGDCCENEDANSFKCSWKIEKVELPQPSAFVESDAGAESASGEGKEGEEKSGSDSTGSTPTDANTPPDLGAYSTLQSLGQPGGVGLPEGGSAEDLMGSLSANAQGGTQGIVSMIMGMVYPMLKPMLEASIRRISVTIEWPESGSKKSMTAVQFVTNPMQGGLPLTAPVASGGGLMGAPTTATGTTPASPTTGTK